MMDGKGIKDEKQKVYGNWNRGSALDLYRCFYRLSNL